MKFAQAFAGQPGSSLTALSATPMSTTWARIVPILPVVGLDTVRFGFDWSQASRLAAVRRGGPTRCNDPGFVAYGSSQKTTRESGFCFADALNSPVLSSCDSQ